MCRVCRTAILPVTEPRCKRCSKPLIDLEAELCENCRSHEFCVDRGFALYPYNERMQKAIRNLKYRGELAGGEDQEVQVAVLLLEAAQGQRAVEIHRQEVRPEAALPEAEHAVQLGMDGKGDGVVRLEQRGHGRILRWYQKMAGFVRFSGTMRSI